MMSARVANGAQPWLQPGFGSSLGMASPSAAGEDPSPQLATSAIIDDDGYDHPHKIQRTARTSSPRALLPSDSSPSPIEDDDDICFFGDGGSLSSDVNVDRIESMIAQEMAALSMQDREKVYYDIHGISGEVEETPELIRNSLDQMELELGKIDDKHAFDLALSLDRDYVQDETSRLKFLRAEYFDASKAARRMVNHFDVKLDLFGRDLLVKDIVQDDLDKEAMDVVYSGKLQTLPERDRAGRVVIVQLVQSTEFSVDAKLRACFYLSTTTDEETEKKGAVAISYLVGQEIHLFQNMQHRREWNAKVTKILESMPLRYEAFHICHDSFAWRVLLAVFKLATNQFNRVRIREHYGDRNHCLFSLQGFGIPTYAFPMAEDQSIMAEDFLQKLEKRRAWERLRQKELANGQAGGQSPSETIHSQFPGHISVPGRNDVLLGRGKAAYRHIGNVRLRNLIEERGPVYEEASLLDKQQMSADIVSLIQQSAGRFLKDEGTGWVEVPDTVARRKVAHAFRTLRHVKARNMDD